MAQSSVPGALIDEIVHSCTTKQCGSLLTTDSDRSSVSRWIFSIASTAV